MKAKRVRESLYEFERGMDPKKALGINRTEKLRADLEEINRDLSSLTITDHFTLIPNEDIKRAWGMTQFLDILYKYMTKEKNELIQALLSRGDINEKIKNALDKGVPIKDIELLIEKFGEKGDIIRLKKFTRTREQEEEETEENIYVFLGYEDKVPVTINGKKYYEEQFSVENMVKIDKYNPSDLQIIPALKMRKAAQGYENSGVYMLKVPKHLMDKDHYTKIPEHLREIVEKYKIKL